MATETQYRNKALLVDAVQWTGKQKDWPEMFEFLDGNGHGQINHDGSIDAVLYTKKGDKAITPGNWIVKEQGHFIDYDNEQFQFAFKKAERVRKTTT